MGRPQRPEPVSTVAFLLYLETELTRLRSESEANNSQRASEAEQLRRCVSDARGEATQGIESLRQQVATASVGVNGRALDEAAWALVAIAAGAVCQLVAVWL